MGKLSPNCDARVVSVRMSRRFASHVLSPARPITSFMPVSAGTYCSTPSLRDALPLRRDDALDVRRVELAVLDDGAREDPLGLHERDTAQIAKELIRLVVGEIDLHRHARACLAHHLVEEAAVVAELERGQRDAGGDRRDRIRDRDAAARNDERARRSGRSALPRP